jgi:thiol-disulfide isomerase/thioredoxin
VVTIKTNFSAALAVMLLGIVAAIDPAAAGNDVSATLGSYPLKSFEGTETKLSSFKGEVVVVNLWASWCAPCRKELPIMNRWHAAWAGRGARVVAIAIDKDKMKARHFAEEANLTFTVLYDSPAGLAKSLDLPSLPCTFILDKKGNVAGVFRSSSSEDLAALQQQVETLLASTGDVAGASTEGETP